MGIWTAAQIDAEKSMDIATQDDALKVYRNT